MPERAVFTGDIVRSSDMDSAGLAQMFDALEGQCAAIGDWPHSSTAFHRFRGDGWQMALPVRYALRGALVMRAAARATGKGRDTRIGIGLGQGEMQNNDLAAATGPAFVAAGHALDNMTRGPLFAAPDAPALLRAALPLADRIVQGWTAKQALIATYLLSPDPMSQIALATRLGTTRQTIQRQTDAAGITALSEACAVSEHFHDS